jgi:hypothetical protein
MTRDEILNNVGNSSVFDLIHLQNRKDAIRNFILFQDTESTSQGKLQEERFDEEVGPPHQESSPGDGSGLSRNPRRLTRAAFSKTLKGNATTRKSVFNIKGLHNLQETFHALDRSIGSEMEPSSVQRNEILESPVSISKAAYLLLGLSWSKAKFH